MWYPNGYANQPAIAQEGATVGGWFTLRLVVQPQSGYILSATVTSATLAEQTSAHAVTPSNPQFQVSSTRYPGDPQSNAIILESLQNLADKHNGQYRVEFSVSYTVSTGSPPPNDRRTFTESGSFTFNSLNLLLVDSRSEPYVVWKPEQMSGIGFSVQLVHAQNGTCTVRLELFDSSDNQNPVLVREFANVPRPGTWSWTWDGKLGDGSTALRGIYLYRLSAYVYGNAPPDRDSNRSDTLGITTTELDYDYEELEWIATCHLNGQMRSGKVEAFAPISLRVVSDGNGQSIEGGYQSRLADFAFEEGGPYVFLMRAWDTGDADGRDKAHRSREALPLNQQVNDYPVALVGTSVGKESLKGLWEDLRKCPPFARTGSRLYRFTPPKGEAKAVFINCSADEACYYLNETAAGTKLWIAYAHGPLETQPQFHGFGIEFANSWLWSHPNAPKPSNVNLSYILPVANPAPHVVVTSCWSGVNHEDPRSLMGVLRGKGTSNRVSWDRKIAVAEADVFYDGFGSSIYEQTKKGHLDYRKAIIAGARKVKDFLCSGVNLMRQVDLPVLHNEQEINVDTE